MKQVIISDSTDVYFNLAAEEYLLRSENQPIIFIYFNENCVVLGRNQNAYEELNFKFCYENNIFLARRISGGGTVFHDEGNINIAWINEQHQHLVNRYESFLMPLVNYLKGLGLEAKLNSRNAIECNGYKVSGSAQFTRKNSMLTHCTLLYDSQLDKLNQCLQMNSVQTESKASKSVRSEVANLKDLLNVKDVTITDFVKNLILALFETETRTFTEDEKVAIAQIAHGKMITNEWIYQRSPKCIQNFKMGGKQISIQIEKAILQAIFVDGKPIKSNFPFGKEVLDDKNYLKLLEYTQQL